MRSIRMLARGALIACTVAATASLLPLSVLAQSSSSSTGTSGGSGVPAFVESISGAYPIDWAQVPDVQPALTIQSDTELGPCVCDLTWSSCDANCLCDADCTASEKATFSAALAEGPQSEQVLTCLDPELVSINDRGALTVTLVNNLLCVAEDNNPSLGRFITAPTSLTDAQFTKARSDERFQFTQGDPVAALAAALAPADQTDTSYKVGSIVLAARQDVAVTTSVVYYPTNGGNLVLPSAASDGQCSDASFVRYLHSDARSCLRSVSDLAAACTAGSILSGTKYVDNIKVGILRTSSPSLPTQYVSANISAVWYLDAATGALTFVSSQSYTTSSGSVNGTATTTATLGPFTFPEPTWNLATCTCDNVLHSVSYLVTHEAGGQVSSIPAPRIEAVVTSVTASSSAGVCGAAQVAQSYSVDWQLSDHVLSPPAEIIRPKSGNPGYLIGRPVLSGNLHTQLITPLAGGSAASVTRSAIAQDTNGMSVLPIADDGLCTPSSGGGTQQAVTFGQDAKFVCYLSLNLAQLQALCAAGVGVGGVLPYFGNISSMVGVWGSSSFEHVNEWVTLSVASPAAGTWFDGTRTCAGITTTVGLEFATTDAGAFKNPQTRILAARQTYATSTWQFLGEDPTLPQKFPVAATVTFVHVAATSIDVYTPRSPPLLPDFPNDLLYPLYIESAAPSTVSATSAASALLLSLLASALLTTLW